MLRKLPGDSQVVDLTLMTPTPVKQTPLKHTTQEIACTTNSLPLQVRYEENTLVSGASENGLNAKNTNIINESQRNESATRTTPDAFCIPMSSPLRQHTSTQSTTPGPQLKPIQTPLSRDQLDRVQKNRELAHERLASRSDRTGESGSNVTNANMKRLLPAVHPPLTAPAACSATSTEQHKCASLTNTVTILQPLHEQSFLAAPRNVRQKLEVPFSMRTGRANSPSRESVKKETFCSLLRDWPRPRKPCPDVGCGGDLVLKWGNVRRPHFAHVGSSHRGRGCSGGESLMHLTAKEAVSRHLSSGGKFLAHISCATCMRLYTHTLELQAGEEVQMEFILPSGTADIGVFRPGNTEPRFVVEIHFTNRTALARRSCTPWFEFEAEEVLSEIGKCEWGAVPKSVDLRCVRQDRKCTHPKCYTLQALAQNLGYFEEPTNHYSSENEKEVHMAMVGYYTEYKACWVRRPDYGIDDDGKEIRPSKEVHQLWKAFLLKGKCIRCAKPHVASKYKPFCQPCYATTLAEARDGNEMETVYISGEEKARLRRKFAWIGQLKNSNNRFDVCQICSTHDEDVPSRVWWLGKHKRLCSHCLASWPN